MLQLAITCLVIALIAAVWIRPSVTPNVKVIAYNDTPLQAQSTILAGEVIVAPEEMHLVEKAARTDGSQVH